VSCGIHVEVNDVEELKNQSINQSVSQSVSQSIIFKALSFLSTCSERPETHSTLTVTNVHT